MSEIKPVYQRRIQDDDWQEIEHSEYVEFSERGKFQTRILYPAAAYEALQKENAEQQSRYSALHQQKKELRSEINLIYEPEIKNLQETNAAQAKRIAELEETNGLLQTQVHCLEMVAALKNGE